VNGNGLPILGKALVSIMEEYGLLIRKAQEADAHASYIVPWLLPKSSREDENELIEELWPDTVPVGMCRVEHSIRWEGSFVPPGLTQRVLAQVSAGLDSPIMWHTGVVAEAKLMKDQEKAVTFRLLLLSETKENEGKMCLNIGVSGTEAQLKDGWIGQMLLGTRSEGLPQGGVDAAMEVLKQFKGSACNHYAHHPQGGKPIKVSTLIKDQKETPQASSSQTRILNPTLSLNPRRTI